GLELAGFSTRVAAEIEPYACETLRRNRDARVKLPDGGLYLSECEVIERSVTEISGAELLRAARLKRGQATLLAGGPPCVTFSVAGRRAGLSDETGRLFEEYVRLLRAVRPAALIYENVKGLMSAVDEDGTPGGAFHRIHDAIEAEGYTLTYRVINMADYGIPQHRERVIIVGRRGRRPFDFPEPTYRDFDRTPPADEDPSGRDPWRDVRWALSGLPPASPPGTREPEVANHVARRHTPKVVRSFAATRPGQRNQRFKRDRLRWDRPAKVIRAQGKVKADGSGQKNSSHQALHPEKARQLTPRECARIQSFPDWYWLPPQFVNSYRIVGDAVPPAFAQLIGEAVATQLGLDEETGQKDELLAAA
ncbi:MAG: DNA cytosine methyltransferase, partial [Actinobacteria bacterium]|nr:DNA cytosine methyltransferase [Actinomycetota bacterium]